MRIAICLAAGAIALAGCASAPLPTVDAEPAYMVQDKAMATPRDGSAVLVVKRDPGFFGGGCDHDIFVDGRQVASLRPAQVVTLYPPAGDHIVGVKATKFICSGTAETQTTIAPGQRRTFRTALDLGGGLLIQPTAF